MLFDIFRALHMVGLVLGVGMVTAGFILGRLAAKNKEIASVMPKIMPSMSKAIWAGLILLIISGIGIQATIFYEISEAMTIFKHILVLAIIVNGVLISGVHRKMARTKDKNAMPQLAKRMGKYSAIGFVLWWAVTIMSSFL